MFTPEKIDDLPLGSIYVVPTNPDANENFSVRMDGVHIAATVTVFGASDDARSWSVTVTDRIDDTVVATATVTGTQLRAAQRVAGLLAGCIAAVGGPAPLFPTVRDLRDMLGALAVAGPVGVDPAIEADEVAQAAYVREHEQGLAASGAEAVERVESGTDGSLSATIEGLTAERNRLRRAGRFAAANTVGRRIDALMGNE